MDAETSIFRQHFFVFVRLTLFLSEEIEEEGKWQKNENWTSIPTFDFFELVNTLNKIVFHRPHVVLIWLSKWFITRVSIVGSTASSIGLRILPLYASEAYDILAHILFFVSSYI